MAFKEKISLTGRPGVGKTTLIERALAGARLSVGGILGKEILVCGHRVGFSLTDLATGREGVLAHLHQRIGPKVGRYTVNLETLEKLAIPAILSAVDSKDLVVIDEFAPMELASPRFVPAVETAWASDKGVLIATHATLDHPLVHRIRQESHLLRVKVSNRDRLVDELRAILRQEP
jgi:nucleoside-triphosphatase